MEIVGAALDLHIYCAAAGQSLLRIEAVRDDVNSLDGFHRRYVSGDVRKPNVVAAGAIDTHVVGARAGSVYVVAQCPRGVRRHRVLIGWHWKARNHPKHALVITHGHRKFAQLQDRKSTRLNSSHGYISYAVFCLKKKNKLHIDLAKFVNFHLSQDPTHNLFPIADIVIAVPVVTYQLRPISLDSIHECVNTSDTIA